MNRFYPAAHHDRRVCRDRIHEARAARTTPKARLAEMISAAGCRPKFSAITSRELCDLLVQCGDDADLPDHDCRVGGLRGRRLPSTRSVACQRAWAQEGPQGRRPARRKDMAPPAGKPPSVPWRSPTRTASIARSTSRMTATYTEELTSSQGRQLAELQCVSTDGSTAICPARPAGGSRHHATKAATSSTVTVDHSRPRPPRTRTSPSDHVRTP